MNVLIVWDADYPWDIRVSKVASSLVTAGHSVTIACRNVSRLATFDSYEGSLVRRLPVFPRWSVKLNRALSFPAFFSPLWLKHIYESATESKADVIVVRDLPLALSALTVARRLRLPCVLDMAECYPEMLRCTWKFEGLRLRNVVLRNPYLADIVERVALRGVDEVWVMIEESRERLIRMGVPPNKIRIVSNTPDPERFGNSSSSDLSLRTGGRTDIRPLRLVYVGLLNPSRGLDTAIRAVAKLIADGGACEFLIAGDGKARSDLQELARRLGVDECVKFLGWLDNSRVPELVGEADAGIVPHHRCTHWETTIPNKLFDYMAAGVPVVVSDVRPMRRIVAQLGCGVVYKDYDVEELASVLGQLSDVDVRLRMGERGRCAVQETYNWKREQRTILESLQLLTGGR